MRILSGLLLVITAAAQSPTLTQLRFGGSGQDTLGGFAIDSQGNYYIAGTTSSLDLPATAFQSRPGGAFLYRVRPGNIQPLFPGEVTTIAAGDGTLYAAYSRAIWTSADNADTWSRLDGPWPAHADCTVIAPGPGVLYVLCPQDNGPGNQPQSLFRSYDRGVSWSQAPVTNIRLASLTIDPANPRSLFAAATGIGWFDFWTGVHSADAGETWSPIGLNLLRFAFHPTNPKVVFAGDGYSLYRSPDSGATWNKLPSPQDFDRFVSGASLAVLPSGRVFYLSGNRLHIFDGITFTSYPLPSEDRICHEERLRAPHSSLLATSPSTLYLTLCGIQSSSVYRSDNGGAAWTRLNPNGLPTITGQVLTSAGDYLITVRKSLDGFVAKLKPDGTLAWSTFLGGVHDDSIHRLALDATGDVYVTGTTQSGDFPFTGAPLAAPSTPPFEPSSFVAKLSASGTALAYARVFAYGAQTGGIAVDPSGAAYLTGNAGASLPTTPGATQRYAVDGGRNPFVLKLNPTGDAVDYATFLAPPSYTYFPRILAGQPQQAPIYANAIAVDPEGHAYVGGTYIWKLNPAGTAFTYSTKLDGGTVYAVAVDAQRNLYLGGSANTETFFTTHAAFQPFVSPTICSFEFNPDGTQRCSASPGFVTKFNAEASVIPYSTYLGGDAFDTVLSLAVRPDGSVIAGGQTQSRAFPTRAPVQGPLLSRLVKNGFLTALAPAGDAVSVSTYISGAEPWQPVAVALDPAGNPTLAGHTLTDDSGILLLHLDTSDIESLNPRLDGVLNAANRIATPLAAAQRVALPGAGFEPGSLVCFGEAHCVEPLATSPGELIAAPTAELPGSGPVGVYVQLPGGIRSNTVLMPAGPAEFAVYPANATGVLARNEDGTLNSPANPARRGAAVTIPFNGPRPATPPAGLLNMSFSAGPFPGLPGELPLLHATIDPDLPPTVTAIALTGTIFPGNRLPLTLSIAPPMRF